MAGLAREHRKIGGRGLVGTRLLVVSRYTPVPPIRCAEPSGQRMARPSSHLDHRLTEIHDVFPWGNLS